MQKTANRELLQYATEKVSRCDRCGACLPICPLFGVKGVEATSARGKNTIARALAEGGIEPTRELLDVVNFCLLCRACKRGEKMGPCVLFRRHAVGKQAVEAGPAQQRQRGSRGLHNARPL